jgi:hypothetical protein
MSVPKTTMHKNDNFTRGKHQVWPARKVFRVKPVPKAGGMKKATNAEFRFCVLMADKSHLFASRRIRQDRITSIL